MSKAVGLSMQHSGSTEIRSLDHGLGPPNVLSLNHGPVMLVAELAHVWWAGMLGMYKHLMPPDGLELCKSHGDEEIMGVLIF